MHPSNDSKGAPLESGVPLDGDLVNLISTILSVSRNGGREPLQPWAVGELPRCHSVAFAPGMWMRCSQRHPKLGVCSYQRTGLGCPADHYCSASPRGLGSSMLTEGYKSAGSSLGLWGFTFPEKASRNWGSKAKMFLNSFEMFVSKCIFSQKPLKVTSSEEPLGHRVPSLCFKKNCRCRRLMRNYCVSQWPREWVNTEPRGHVICPFLPGKTQACLLHTVSSAGAGFGTVVPNSARASLCVLHLCDSAQGLGLPGAPHGDGILFLLWHGSLENRYAQGCLSCSTSHWIMTNSAMNSNSSYISMAF